MVRIKDGRISSRIIGFLLPYTQSASIVLLRAICMLLGTACGLSNDLVVIVQRGVMHAVR
jgi:hypothetical protein